MRIKFRNIISVVFAGAVIFSANNSCRKEENPIKFPHGAFPDSIINLTGINSAYDDYNSSTYEVAGGISIVFSSNRESAGGQFDIAQGLLEYHFNQTTGDFCISSQITTDIFISNLLAKAVTQRNDFGPYRFFSTIDGMEYMILASENEQGKLDLRYLKNSPTFGSSMPEIAGPFPVSLLNTESDEAYICLDSDMDSLYFSSDRNGDYDIFVQDMNTEEFLSDQFENNFIASSQTDSINSTENDKCPYILKRVMVFASDRLGGLGGYDLYYSLQVNGRWSSPVNFGPGINTSSDEYRPVLGTVQDFTNAYMIFSSNRTGGRGGFDLYLTGFNMP